MTIGTLLAAVLVTLCIGLQVLEATGRWDRDFQETGDEAVLVSVVLCIGTALVVASAVRPRAPRLSATLFNIFLATLLPLSGLPPSCSAFGTSPPISLRI